MPRCPGQLWLEALCFWLSIHPSVPFLSYLSHHYLNQAQTKMSWLEYYKIQMSNYTKMIIAYVSLHAPYRLQHKCTNLDETLYKHCLGPCECRHLYGL